MMKQQLKVGWIKTCSELYSYLAESNTKSITTDAKLLFGMAVSNVNIAKAAGLAISNYKTVHFYL
jgi:hypothetical protein